MTQCKIFSGPHPDVAFNEWISTHGLYKICDIKYQHVEKGLYSILLIYNDGKDVRVGGPAPA